MSTATAAAADDPPQAQDISTTQVTPCKMEEDTAVPMPGVYDLLHTRDWEALKNRAESHPESMPADFIAQLFIAAAPGPSPQDFEWFMSKFGNTAGLYGFGFCSTSDASSRDHLILYMNAQLQKSLGLGEKPRKGIFSSMTCGIAAVTTLNSFMERSRPIREDFITYLFDQFSKYTEENGYDGETVQREWKFCKDCLEAFIYIKSEQYGSDLTIALQQNNEMCVSHAIIYVLQQISDHQGEGEHVSLSSVIACLKQIKKLEPGAFAEKNAYDQTLLDLVLDIDASAFESQTGAEGERYAKEVRYELAKFLIEDSPELARIRNCDDELPMHAAFKMQRDPLTNNLLDLLYKAEPRSAEMRSLSTGLYPFQIAAARAHRVAACGCSSCGDYYDRSDTMVGSIYMLLRDCPRLVESAISDQEGSPETKDTSSKLSDELSMDLAQEELQLSRKRLEFQRLRNELVLEEEEVKTKKRKLMQASMIILPAPSGFTYLRDELGSWIRMPH